jgi:serine/threonine-protein kinase
MARVDLAEDTLLRRQVALKRIAGPADPHGLSRLRREALAGASLSHPNLVSVYDAVTSEEGHLVIVMEYIAGGTLRDELNRRRRLPADEALRVLEGVAAGLDAIHGRGIVHRDVKPSNILLGEAGTVKIADLGIAAVPDRTRITVSGSVLGSLSYMAPEQLDSARSTPAIDVYAPAAVAYEALSGEKARQETNALTLAHAMATQPPPNLRSAWAGAPPAASEVLVQGMARDPAARPRSAGELVGRLRAALAPGASAPALSPVPSRTAPGPSRPRAVDRRAPARPVSTHRAGRSPTGPVIAALLALVAALVVLAVLLNSSGSRSPHSRRPAARAHHAAPRRPSSSTSASSGSSSRGATSPAPPTSTPSATSPAPPSSPAAASPAPASATSPVGAVEAFYGAAAAHHYAAAWALADPTLRAQLLDYPSFAAGQAGDRSITFNSAKVVSQSSQFATVAVQTTSVRDNGTQHCSGTVDLVPGGAGGGWRLHLLHINCT